MRKLCIRLLLLSVCSWQALASPTFRRVVPPDVPADKVDTFNSLPLALSTAPALAPGAVIQIEPGARPASLTASQLNTALGLASFTLRGNPAFDASELPIITIQDAVSVTGTGVRWENLNLVNGANGSLTANGPGFVFSNNIVVDQSNSGTLRLNSTGAVVSSNRLRDLSGIGGTAAIRVQAATGSVISDNQIVANAVHALLSYETAGAKNDIVERNVFRGAVGNAATVQVEIRTGVTNVTLRKNLFTDSDSYFGVVFVAAGAQNIVIEANRFEFPATDTSAMIACGSGTTGLTTSFTVRGNEFITPAGTNLGITLTNTGSASAVVEGNRFRGAIGISVTSAGIAPTNIDLGGGTGGSLGGNDFTFFSAAAASNNAAIVAGSGSGTISAANNVFAGDAEAAVFDQSDDGARFNLNTSNASTENAAFVAALFSRFLHKPANFGTDAGSFRDKLDAGTKRATVARSIIRSDDALTFLISERYRAILLRQPEAEELAAALRALKRATGSEEALIASLFANPEGNQIRGSARAFVADLFTQLLQRTPTDDELLKFGKQASRSRSLATKAVLATTEFKTLRVKQVFEDLLRRVPTEEETRKFLKTNRLNLQAAVVTLPEFAAGN